MELTVTDVPEMYSEMLAKMKVLGHEQPSRNGPVFSIPEPVTVTVKQPWHRVLMDENRCANPFFHVMEFVWMMSGSNQLRWIQQFNKRFKDYADEDGTLHGAYGYRWRKDFGVDQVEEAIHLLREHPDTRRAVLGMWRPEVDLNTVHNDLPCNTHIYLRRLGGALNMTVCNRSNDIVWGMTGANAVHMTMLQELIAHGAEMDVGTYTVFTNNAHLYREQHGHLLLHYHEPQRVGVVPDMLLEKQERWQDFLLDCEDFVAGDHHKLRTVWMSTTAKPMYETYLNQASPHKISCPEWRIAAVQWLHWVRQ